MVVFLFLQHFSNPNFEFWLLLHFNIVNELDQNDLLQNKKINSEAKSSVRYITSELRKVLGTFKKNKFKAEILINNIDTAIKNEKNYCESLPDLKYKLGSNIGVFIEKLRYLSKD